jgi:hypothetical protein
MLQWKNTYRYSYSGQGWHGRGVAVTIKESCATGIVPAGSDFVCLPDPLPSGNQDCKCQRNSRKLL